MTKRDLRLEFEKASDLDLDICIEVTVPNSSKSEYILTHRANLAKKLIYYMNNYKEEINSLGEKHLVLERCPEIEILSVEVIDFSKEWEKK